MKIIHKNDFISIKKYCCQSMTTKPPRKNPQPKWHQKLFEEYARKIHGDKYDYRLVPVERFHSHLKVPIICKETATEHTFYQTVGHHIGQKCRCGICHYKGSDGGGSITFEMFKEGAEEMHEDGAYNYDHLENAEFIGTTHTKVPIFCERCQLVFQQEIRYHLQGFGHQHEGTFWKHDLTKFLKAATEIHCDADGNAIYNYSLIKKEDIITTHMSLLKVICKTHGVFKTTIQNHIHHKSGCRDCVHGRKVSILEVIIQATLCWKLNIFPTLVGNNTQEQVKQIHKFIKNDNNRSRAGKVWPWPVDITIDNVLKDSKILYIQVDGMHEDKNVSDEKFGTVVKAAENCFIVRCRIAGSTPIFSADANVVLETKYYHEQKLIMKTVDGIVDAIRGQLLETISIKPQDVDISKDEWTFIRGASRSYVTDIPCKRYPEKKKEKKGKSTTAMTTTSVVAIPPITKKRKHEQVDKIEEEVECEDDEDDFECENNVFNEDDKKVYEEGTYAGDNI